jgi:hypothetical protein
MHGSVRAVMPVLVLACVLAWLSPAVAAGDAGGSFITAPITLEQAETHNLISNGGFEEIEDGIPVDWHPGGFKDHFAVSTDQPFDGRRYWQVTGGTRVYGSHREVPVVPNAPYVLIVHVKQDGVTAGEGGLVEVRWEGEGGRSWTAFGRIQGNFGWRRFVYALQAPPQAKTAAIYLEKIGSSGRVGFDHVVFAHGIIKKAPEDLTREDWARGVLQFEYLRMEFDRFLVESEPLVSAALKQRIASLRQAADAGQGKLRRESGDPAGLAVFLAKNTKRLLSENADDINLKNSPLSLPWGDDLLELRDQMQSCERDVRGYLREKQPQRNARAIHRVFGERAEYGIGVTSNLHKVLRDQPYLGEINDQAQVALARNEHEGFQVVVLPLAKRLQSVRVVLDDLKSSDGHVLSKANLRAFPVGYVDCRDAGYSVDYAGWWPDPLLTDATFDVEPGKNQPVWVDVYAPEDQPPGDYAGILEIVPQNAPPTTLRVQVTVWNYAIPRRGRFKVLGRFRPDALVSFYKWKALPPDVYLKWCLFQVEHRYSPTDIYASTMTPDKTVLAECLRAGLNAVVLSNISQLIPYDRTLLQYGTPDEQQKAQIASILKNGVQSLNEHGALDTAYVYCFDEVHNRSTYPLIRDICSYARAVAPAVKIATTTTYPPIEPLVEAVDAWVPLLGTETSEIEARQVAGDEVFFYIYGLPIHPFPNASLIEYPALDGRISFWIAFNKGWSGFLHWYTNGWETNAIGDKRWPEVPWIPYCREQFKGRNGEGYFVYPGPDGEPLSSIRFEAIRDGIEDWEAMYILRQLVADASRSTKTQAAVARARTVLTKARSLAPGEYHYCMDPEKLLALRLQIGDAIESLQTEATQ